MEPPTDKMGALYDVLNRCNDMVWTGAFTYWAEQKLMVWRYGLVLSGGQMAGPEQIDRLIASAVSAIFFCMRSPLREERTLETRIGCSKRQRTSL